MKVPGRPRYAAVIHAQLDLYLEQNADLLKRVEAAKATYDHAGRPGSEEAYGVYMDAVEEAEDTLLELRDRYAETMAARERGRYEREFSRAAERMLPTLSARRQYLRAIDPDSTT
ncbi:MAG TPA: hypothetical protein VHS27_20440 [Gaiellales bacterium]|jgi:hypothetical protein|nr:hypothetical protein [Gaiellales bacterium]